MEFEEDIPEGCIPTHGSVPPLFLMNRYPELAPRARELLDDLRLVQNAVRKALQYLDHHVTAPHKPTQKEDGTLTIPEDQAAQDIILSHIREKYPNDGFLAEEDVREGLDKPRIWIVDGLDGTHEFIAGRKSYASAVALAERGRVLVSVIGRPQIEDERESLFYAVRGVGAFKNGEPLNVRSHWNNIGLERARGVTHKWVLETLRRKGLGEGSAYILDGHSRSREEKALAKKHIFSSEGAGIVDYEAFEELQAVERKPRCYQCGSSSATQAAIAEGTLDWYASMTLKPWDAAAGSLIIEEAGGKVTTWEGRPRKILSSESFLATNIAIHGEFVRLLYPLLSYSETHASVF